jgi:hypothetical protein
MYLKRLCSCFLFLLYSFGVKAQKNTTEISFQLLYNKTPLELGQSYPISGRDSLKIDFLKFYLSNITFFKDGNQIGKSTEKYHLIDAQNSSLYRTSYTVKNKKFDTIRLTIGLDTKTQKKGIQGGVLDPTSGMYWTWQNGFINFKIEGRSKLCNTRKNKFQFHVGGFQKPYETTQVLNLACIASESLTIDIDVASFFNVVSLSETNTVMSPNKNAVRVSKVLATLFSIHEN